LKYLLIDFFLYAPAAFCHSGNEVAIACPFYGFHGISYGNVLPAKAAPAAAAHPQRGDSPTSGFAQFIIEMLRGLCASSRAFIIRGKCPFLL